jgi:hypothetical protein
MEETWQRRGEKPLQGRHPEEVYRKLARYLNKSSSCFITCVIRAIFSVNLFFI